MVESLKKFYEYMGSDEELMYYVRMNAEWNEESFIKMEQLVREVIKDYKDKDDYPKHFIRYFMIEVPSVINLISHFKRCDEKALSEGYTEETYLNMIAEKVKQLEKLRWDFIYSLIDKYIDDNLKRTI